MPPLALDRLWTHAVGLPHLLLLLTEAPGWSLALVCHLPYQALSINAVTARTSAHHDQTCGTAPISEGMTYTRVPLGSDVTSQTTKHMVEL